MPKKNGQPTKAEQRKADEAEALASVSTFTQVGIIKLKNNAICCSIDHLEYMIKVAKQDKQKNVCVGYARTVRDPKHGRQVHVNQLTTRLG